MFKKDKNKGRQKSNLPKVFIIILNFYGFNDTLECVHSVLKNTYKNFKVIIIDNNSGNNSFAILKNEFEKYEKVEVYQTEKNLGFVGGVNLGTLIAIKSGADYIFVLNNDTVVDKNFLTPCIRVMEKNKRIGAVSGMVKSFDKKTIQYAGAFKNLFLFRSRIRGKGEEDRGQFNASIEVDRFAGPAFCLRTEVILRVGMFREHWFFNGEELYLSFKLKKAGYKIMYVPFSYVYHKRSRTVKKYPIASTFFGLRNLIWFERLYANFFEFFIFFSYIFLYLLPKLIIKHIFYRKFSAIPIMFLALKEGFLGDPENQFSSKDFRFLLKKEI